MSVKTIFPVKIFHEESFLSQEHCRRIYDFLISQKTTRHSLLSENSESSFNEKDNLNLPKEIDFFEVLQNRLTYYCQELDIPDCKIRDTWFNIQEENSSLALHAHPLSAISGVVFINVDENSSPLCLMNPNYSSSFFKQKRGSESLSIYHKITPKIGDLIIFPSWVIHGSLNYQNKTKKRMVISFNAVNF